MKKKLALVKHNSQLAVKEQAEKYEREMTKLKEELSQKKEMENKNVVEKLQKDLKEKEETIEDMQATWEDARSEIIDNTMRMEEITSLDLQQRTKSLKDNTGRCEQIQLNQRTGLKTMEGSHRKTPELPHETRHLIQLLNQNILAGHELKNLKLINLKRQ